MKLQKMNVYLEATKADMHRCEGLSDGIVVFQKKLADSQCQLEALKAMGEMPNTKEIIRLSTNITDTKEVLNLLGAFEMPNYEKRATTCKVCLCGLAKCFVHFHSCTLGKVIAVLPYTGFLVCRQRGILCKSRLSKMFGSQSFGKTYFETWDKIMYTLFIHFPHLTIKNQAVSSSKKIVHLVAWHLETMSQRVFVCLNSNTPTISSIFPICVEVEIHVCIVAAIKQLSKLPRCANH